MVQRRLMWRSALLVGALGSLSASIALAQSASLRGRVLTDSLERPIPGAIVSIVALKLQATTDTLGDFFIPNVAPGAHVVSVRKIGFGPVAAKLNFGAHEGVEADLLLTRTLAQSLPDVTVETKAAPRGKLVEFDTRHAEGFGRFLTQADLEKRPFATFTDALRQIPGIGFVRNVNNPSEYYVVAGRMSLPVCALCGGPRANGSAAPCYAAVVLDGSFVYGVGGQGEANFNLNSIDPSHIAGVEYYTGAAAIPAKYNGTRSTCGLLMIWTR